MLLRQDVCSLLCFAAFMVAGAVEQNARMRWGAEELSLVETGRIVEVTRGGQCINQMSKSRDAWHVRHAHPRAQRQFLRLPRPAEAVTAHKGSEQP